MIGDPNLERRVAQQAAHDRRADRPGAAGYEDAGHRVAELSRGIAAGKLATRPDR